MPKSDPKKDPELHPDAWPRFERFIREVAKAGPQHRTKARVGIKKKGKRKKGKNG